MMKLNFIQHSRIFILIVVPLSLGFETNVEIIKGHPIPGDLLKTNVEAEWAFLTEMFNFVNDDLWLSGTPWASYMLKFMSYRNGHEAFNTRMTETYYSGGKIQLCMAYLSDPIFSDNVISFYNENPENPITLETKSVKFSYFSRNGVVVKVVGCPILINDVESRIYFQEFNYISAHFGPDMRGYFVFGSISDTDQRWPEAIRILMYTPHNSQPLKNLDLSGREIPKDTPEHMIMPASEIPTIRITNNIMEYIRNSIHAFGEVAEVYFLTKYYGFFNPIPTYWKVKNLILIMEHLRTDYEINVKSLKLEMMNKRNKEMCLNHMKTNIHLVEQGIFIREDLINSVVKWETKHIGFLFLERNFDDLKHDRHRKLLKCPAYFDEIKWPNEGHEYLYLLPIFYKISNKPEKVFMFVEYLDGSNRVRPISLTPVNSDAFEDYGNDEFISANESYSTNEKFGGELDPTDIPTTSQFFIN